MRRGWVIGVLAAVTAAAAFAGAHADDSATVSFTAGGRDASGAFMGGTELRNLVACHGRLYAGNGYWEEAFIPARSPQPAGHEVIGALEAGGWYLVRRANGHYEIREIAARQPVTGLPLVAIRTIARSPFAGEDALYVGGYDANKRPAHNTAWVLRLGIAAVLGPR